MPTARTIRPTLNFDAPEPVVATDSNASALFPAQPIYARTPKKKASSNMPLLIGAPIVAVAAGALIWGMTTHRAEAPTDPQSLQVAAAESPAPLTAPLPPESAATPALIPQPTEIAANETPAPAARSTPAPRAAAPARRAAPVRETAPSAETASSNVSATVPATPPTVSAAPAPAIAEPAPLVVPSPAAPQPVPEPSAPM